MDLDIKGLNKILRDKKEVNDTFQDTFQKENDNNLDRKDKVPRVSRNEISRPFAVITEMSKWMISQLFYLKIS